MFLTPRLLLLLGLSLTVPACGGDAAPATATTTGKAFAQRLPGVAGVENFARVNTSFYRGAQPTPEGFKQLKSMGVKTIIDFRSYHSTMKEVEAAGLTPVEIPIKADLGSTPPDEAAIKRYFEVVLDPAKQPVYIHCAFGKDRTGTMAALYRMEIDGWTPDEAIQEMQSFGYHDIYRDLIAFVKAYKPRGYAKGK